MQFCSGLWAWQGAWRGLEASPYFIPGAGSQRVLEDALTRPRVNLPECSVVREVNAAWVGHAAGSAER